MTISTTDLDVMETETKYNNLKSYEISVYIIFWVPLIPTD